MMASYRFAAADVMCPRCLVVHTAARPLRTRPDRRPGTSHLRHAHRLHLRQGRVLLAPWRTIVSGELAQGQEVDEPHLLRSVLMLQPS